MRSRALTFCALAVITGLIAALTTSAQGALRAPPAMQISEIATRDLALTHITGQPETFGLASGDVAEIVVTGATHSDQLGITSVYLQQEYLGIEIFGAVMNVTVDDLGAVIATSGAFVPGIAKLAPSTTPSLSTVDAVAAATAILGLTQASTFAKVTLSQGQERSSQVSDGGVSLENISTRLVLQPIDGDVRLAWEATIYEVTAENWWQLRVDAVTGEELDRNNLVTADSYSVYAQPLEAPTFGPRTLEVDPADLIASPFGWHDTDGITGAEFTVTQGNNATAYTDTDGDNVMDPGSQADGGASLVFDFPLDLASAPSVYRDAAVTELFYWTNRAHDIFYAYGFDEAAGNFQTNSYGRGGIGSDAVRAEAQDGLDINTANFATPIDGSPPRLQMFVWDFVVPNRDSSLDNGIIAHEYAHGVTTRLAGGPNNIACLQNAEQPGEGWSDYFALMFTMNAGHDGSTPRGIGTYALGQATTGPGIRDFPYSTNMAVDPRTYDTIKTAALPHGVGSTFAAMLWDMTWDLIDRDGFDPDLINGTGGNITAMQLVMDALKLQPCSPGFVDARNAILLADLLQTGGTNECLIWRAFAKRGLGIDASQGVSASRSDGTENFDVPSNCVDLALDKVASQDSVVAGSDVTFSLTVTNNTAGPFTSVTITDPVPAGTTFVAGSADCGGSLVDGEVIFPVGNLTAFASATCSFTSTVDPAPSTLTLFSDGFEAGSTQWVLNHGSGTADWELSTVAPHGSTTAVFAIDASQVSDQLLTTSQPIPATSNTRLRFWHRYDTENAWDGGVVEFSTDGVIWADAGPLFVANGYNGILNTSPNPLATRAAFTGNSGGYQESVIDLGSLAGNNVHVRFRFGTDEAVGADGWHVDDVVIRNETHVSNTASATSNEASSAPVGVEILVVPPPGLLRVTTAPAVPGVIEIDGLWTDAFGLDWAETEAGPHQICFSDVPGFTSPPCQMVTVQPEATALVQGNYLGHGTLDVRSNPAVATTITVDGLPVNDWGAIVSLEPGTYEVCFGAVPDFDTPPCVNAVVVEGATSDVTGEFIANPGAQGPVDFGLLRVTTSPPVASQLLIDGNRAVSYGLDWLKLAPGQYQVCFSDVPGFSAPGCESVAVQAGLTTTLEGVFEVLAELRVLTSPPGNQPVTVDGRTVDQYGFWTWVPPDVQYNICASGFSCQIINPPSGVLTTVTLEP